MTITDSGEKQLRRVLFVIGTAHYTSANHEAREDVPGILRRVVNTLTPLGFEVHFAPSGYLLDPDRNSLRTKIHQARAQGDIVVIYYTGHGEDIEHEGHYLITSDFDWATLPDAGLKVVDIPALVAKRDGSGKLNSEQAHTLIILDCCFSGAGALGVLRDALWNRRSPANTNLWVWATAGDTQWADAGLFVDALSKVLAATTVGATTQNLSIVTLLDEINGQLESAIYGQKSEVFPPNGSLTGNPPFFPNVKYLPHAAGLTVDTQHWLSKARGTESLAATGYYLTGRTGRVRAATDLARWIADPGSGTLAVVTGSPGTGKSSLLALPALLTDATSRKEFLRRTSATSPAHKVAQVLPETTDIVAIHARGLNTDQIAMRVATDLCLLANDVPTLLDSFVNIAHKPNRIVVVDAVDEATDPASVRDNLLLPLAQRGLRIVFGARPHILSSATKPSFVIDLDTDAYHDPDALADYVAHLLAATHEPDVASSYRGRVEDPDTNTIVAEIARRATSGKVESFLIARVITLAVRARHERVHPSALNWQDSLPDGLSDAFNEEFSALDSSNPATRFLLEALAWARGPGLPWEAIWVPVAQAIADLDSATDHLETQINNDDVRALLNTAGSFITEDLGPGGRSVFRPFHEELATYLRRTEASDTSRIERAITHALLRTVPTDSTGSRLWDRAHPYVRTYLAEHAQAASNETLDALLLEGGFFATADPTTLTPLLLFDLSRAGDEIIRTYRRARPLLGDDPAANAAYLQEAATAVGASRRLHVAGFRRVYRTQWSSVSTDDSLLTFTGHTSSVNALAAITTTTGHTLLASAGGDHTIRLWNPESGTPIGQPLTGHTHSVNALAAITTTTGHTLLASAGDDHTIRLWNPESGGLITVLRRRTAARDLLCNGTTLVIGDEEGLSAIEIW